MEVLKEENVSEPLSIISTSDLSLQPQQLLESSLDSDAKRKRVRTTTVSQACNNCREKHLKCDGVFPVCTRCQVKSITACHYKATRLKRGPVPGIKGKKTEDVSELSADPLGSRNQVRVSPIFDMIDTTSRFETMPFGVAAAEYLEFYAGYISPITAVKPLDINSVHQHLRFNSHNTVSVKETADRSMAVQCLVILAHGSLMIGRKEHSDIFFNVAQEHLKELNGSLNLLNAVTNHAIGWCFFANADIQKASHYNGLTLHMIQNLNSMKIPFPPAQRQHLQVLHASALLHSAEFATTKLEQLSTYVNVMEILNYVQTEDQNDHIYLYASFLRILSIVHKVWTEVTCQIKTGRDINEYMRWLQDAEALIPTTMNNLLRKDVQGLLTACCGGVLHVLNLHELARKCADEVLDTLDDIAYFYSPIVMLSLTMVAQVHYFENNQDKVQQGALIFRQIAKHYPIANSVFKEMFEPLLGTIDGSHQALLMRRKLDLYPNLPMGNSNTQDRNNVGSLSQQPEDTHNEYSHGFSSRQNFPPAPPVSFAPPANYNEEGGASYPQQPHLSMYASASLLSNLANPSQSTQHW